MYKSRALNKPSHTCFMPLMAAISSYKATAATLYTTLMYTLQLIIIVTFVSLPFYLCQALVQEKTSNNSYNNDDKDE